MTFSWAWHPHRRLLIADIVNARIISVDDAAQGDGSFEQGAGVKHVLDPHDEITAYARCEIASHAEGGCLRLAERRRGVAVGLKEARR